MTERREDPPLRGSALRGPGRPRTVQDKPCVVCGTPFRPMKGNANRYCSRDCMLKVSGNRGIRAPWPRA